MKTSIASMAAMGTGAAMTYFLDPERGRRRRAAARDRMVHLRRKATAASDKTARDLSHRAAGALAEARGTMREGLLPRPVDDVILEERVRASLGRVIRHAGAIEVTSQAG